VPDQELPLVDFGVALADALRHIQDSVVASLAEAREAIREVADASADRDGKLAKRASGLENRITTLSSQVAKARETVQEVADASADRDGKLAKRVSELENRIGTLSDQAGRLQSDLRAIGDMEVTIAERVEMLTAVSTSSAARARDAWTQRSEDDR